MRWQSRERLHKVQVENEPEYMHCKRTASDALDDVLKIKGDNAETDANAMYFHRLCDVMEEYLRW